MEGLIDGYLKVDAYSDLAVWLQHRYDRRRAEFCCLHPFNYVDKLIPVKLGLDLGSYGIWLRKRFEMLKVGDLLDVKVGFESINL